MITLQTHAHAARGCGTAREFIQANPGLWGEDIGE